MPKVSRIKIDSKHMGYYINNFWSLITHLENKEQVKIFLKDLLTHTEMKMLSKRIQIAKMLLEGYTYQEIKGYVKVTDSTISKINNILSVDGEGLKTAVKYLHKIEMDIERKMMQSGSSVKEKYPEYFLLDRLVQGAGKELKKRKKRKSAVKDLSL